MKTFAKFIDFRDLLEQNLSEKLFHLQVKNVLLATVITATTFCPKVAQALTSDLNLSSSATGLSLGSTSITYDVSITAGTGTADGNFSGGGGSSVTVTFSQPIDLLVTPPNVELPWNDSPQDAVNLTVSSSSNISVLDPDNELTNELGAGTSNFAWQYSSASDNPNRFPMNQDWSLNALNTTFFNFEITTTGGSSTIANFAATAAVPFEFSPTIGLVVSIGLLGIHYSWKKKQKKGINL